MSDKQAPLGICDHCGQPIPGDPYTTKRTPKRYCSRQCRNTANSRAGAHIISRKNRERIQRGQWQNPHVINPPTGEEQARRARLGRNREVEAGVWRNPALTDQARAKLSRPRVHSDNPVLHSAIEKLSRGTPVADLTPAEQEAHRAYRRQLADGRRHEINANARQRYKQRQARMTPEEREAQRQKWRQENRRRAQQKKADGDPDPSQPSRST